MNIIFIGIKIISIDTNRIKIMLISFYTSLSNYQLIYQLIAMSRCVKLPRDSALQSWDGRWTVKMPTHSMPSVLFSSFCSSLYHCPHSLPSPANQTKQRLSCFLLSLNFTGKKVFSIPSYIKYVSGLCTFFFLPTP